MSTTKIIWTRAQEDWQRDSEHLNKLGLPVLHLPSIRTKLDISEKKIKATLESLLNHNKSKTTTSGQDNHLKLVVTSPKAGQYLTKEQILAPLWQNSDEIITFGQETARRLKNLPDKIISLSPARNSRELASYLVNNYTSSSPFLCIGPNEPAFPLDRYLCEQGFVSSYLSFYETEVGLFLPEQKKSNRNLVENIKAELLEAQEKLLFCFCSPTAFQGLKTSMGSSTMKSLGRVHTAFVLGRTTQQSVEPYFQSVKTAEEPTINALIEELRKSI